MLHFRDFNRFKKYNEGVIAFVDKHNSSNEIVIVQPTSNFGLSIVKINGIGKRWVGIEKGVSFKVFASQIQAVLDSIR